MYFNQNQSVKFLIELNIAQLTKRNNMDYFDIDRDYFVGVYIIKAKKMKKCNKLCQTDVKYEIKVTNL